MLIWRECCKACPGVTSYPLAMISGGPRAGGGGQEVYDGFADCNGQSWSALMILVDNSPERHVIEKFSAPGLVGTVGCCSNKFFKILTTDIL